MEELEDAPIRLTPRAVYGLSCQAKNNIIYTSDHNLGHPCSSVIVVDDMVNKKQSFIYLGQTANTVDRIAVTADRTHLAVAERGERPRISIYSLKTLKRVKLLGNPYEEIKAKDYVDLDFTMDGIYLLALFGKPDFEMLQYDWEKGKVVNRVKVSDKKSPVVGMAPSPYDTEQLVFVGCGVYNRMNYIEHTWRPVGVQKTRHVPFSSVCWLNDKQVAGGTEDGRILVMEPTELRAIYRALTLIQFTNPPVSTVKKVASAVVLDSRNIPLEDRLGKHAVLHLTSFKGGIAYSCETGIVLLFEEIDRWSFKRKNAFNVNRCISRTAKVEGRCNQIVSIAFSPTGHHFALTTDMYEIYVAPIFQEQDFHKDPFLSMKPFDSGYHNGAISQLSLSRWKPFLLTLGATDKSMRLWNFETKKLVNRFDFPKDVYCASIHPSGLLCLLGFTDYLTLNVFVLKSVEEIRKMPLGCCPYACFSTAGHKIGAYAEDMRTIYIFNTLDGAQLHVLKGHVGPITGLNWTRDDQYLWSRGGEGSIYKWDMRSGQRVLEVFTAGVAHLGLSLTPDGHTAFVSSSDGLLRVIEEHGEVKKEISAKHKVLLCVDMSTSGKMLFAAGEKASLISFAYPLNYPYKFQEFIFHRNPVTVIKFSFHDRIMVSVSSEGTLCFWEVKGPVSKVPAVYLTQMMIPLQELTRRDKAMEDTVNRMATYVAETKLNLRELTTKFNSELESVIDMKNEKIKDLEKRLSVMEQDCTLEMSYMKKKLLDDFQKAEQDRQRMEDTLSDSLIKQYKKYNDLRDQMMEQSKEYHSAKDNLETITRDAIENAEVKVKKYLNACSELVKILIMKKYADSKQDEEIRLAIEEDCDKEIGQVRENLEKLLKEEENKNHALKCENVLLKAKFKGVQLKMEIMKTQIDQLHKENGNLKKKMATMHREHEVVSKELEEHLKTEDMLEEQVRVMKEEKKSCEKDKLVTAHVAEEMRSLLEPQEYTIFNLKEQNTGLTLEIKNLHRREVSFKNEIDKLRLLQKSSVKENKSLKLQLITMTNRLKSLRNDISMIRGYETKKLIHGFQLIVRKHLTEGDKMGEFDIAEVIEKELKPHEYKILQLIASGPKTKVCPKRRGYPKDKLMKENRYLIQKLQSLKTINDQVVTETRVSDLSEVLLVDNDQIQQEPSTSKMSFQLNQNELSGESAESDKEAEPVEEGNEEVQGECDRSYDADKAIAFTPSSQIQVVAIRD